ncbi:ATP-binding protein, partial [Microbacteriaceae bacterium K1510]|nr:ATP-binding protein [Microbacteriaceae bacterium K1510]
MEAGLEDVLIPPGTFQPLVENSIQHGLREKTSGGMISISVRKKQQRVEIVIADNGSGIQPEILDRLGYGEVASTEGNGIGVQNVNQRLISLFGPESR